MKLRKILLLLLFLNSLKLVAQEKLAGTYDAQCGRYDPDSANVEVKPFTDGLAPFMIKGKDPFVYHNNRVGFIDKTGLIVIKPVFANASNFYKGLAIVDHINGNRGLIDKTGKLLFSSAYKFVIKCENGDFILWKDNQLAFAKPNGQLFIKPGRYVAYAKPTPIITYSEGNFNLEPFYWRAITYNRGVDFRNYIGVKRDDKWTIINRLGKEIIPPTFDSMEPFINGYATFIMDKKWGLVDTTGKITISAIYQKLELTKNHTVIATSGLKKGVLEVNGRVLIPLEHEILYPFTPTTFIVEDTAARGLMNTKNQIIVPAKYGTQVSKMGDLFLGTRWREITFYNDRGQVVKKAGNIKWFSPPYWSLYADTLQFMVYNTKTKTFANYDDVDDYRWSGSVNRVITYQRGGRLGLLDTNGAERTAAIFDEIDLSRSRESLESSIQYPLAARKADKWGLIDQTGKTVLNFEYDQLDLNTTGVVVKKANKFGLLNKDLKKLTAVRFDRISIRDAERDIYDTHNNDHDFKKIIKNYFINALIKKKWGMLSHSGKPVTLFKYSDEPMFTNGIAIVKNNNKYGVLNEKGDEIIKCMYDYISYVEYTGDKRLLFKKNDLYGLTTPSLKVLAPIKFEQITLVNELNKPENICYWVVQKGKTGLINNNGRVLLPAEFNEPKFLNKNLISAKRDGYFGMTDTTSKLIIPFIYDQLTTVNNANIAHNALYVAIYKKMAGVIDQSNRKLVPFEYEDIISDFSHKLLIAKKGGFYGLIDSADRVVSPFKFDDIYPSSRFITKLNGKMGLLNENGRELVPPNFDDLEYNSYKNHIIVRNERKYGFFSIRGKKLTETIYSNYAYFGENYIKVVKDYHLGLLDLNGKEILPCIYTHLYLKDGKIIKDTIENN